MTHSLAPHEARRVEPGRKEPSRLRKAAAMLILGRVAGSDPKGARDAIHGTPGPRLFPPDSAIARVHGDATMFVGGVRALLLQSLHPRAMAAVAEHSGYESDPWGRLQRTATFLATTTFAPVSAAERAVSVVRAVHSRISGVTPDGEPYEASDPHLLRWVHIAEADSFLSAHQAFGRDPLDAAGCDAYVAEVAQIGHRLGAVNLPTTVAELAAELDRYRPELRSTPAARSTARFLLRKPPIPWFARPPYSALAAGGVGLLPDWARAELGLRRASRIGDAFARLGGSVMTRAIRWALDGAPPITPQPAEN